MRMQRPLRHGDCLQQALRLCQVAGLRAAGCIAENRSVHGV